MIPESAYERLPQFDDINPVRARRVYRCPSGVFVKVHGVRTGGERFGPLQWVFSGSHCDENGTTVAHGSSLRIHAERHELTAHSDPGSSADARAQGLRADYDAACLVVVKRVEALVLDLEAAAAVAL